MTARQSLRKCFADTALELASADPSVVVLVGDISHGIFAEFRSQFSDRYFNVGIMEPAMASIAAGLAMTGLKPIVHTIAPFLIERSFEQLKLDFGYQKLSAMFVSVGGAFDYSNLGCTHHSYIDMAMVASIDDATVCAPATEPELRALMQQSLRKWSGLTYIKLTENGSVELPTASQVEIGVPIKVRDGDMSLAIVSLGPTFFDVKQALDLVSPLGYYPTHIHLHTFQPIDYLTLDEMLCGVSSVLVVEQLNSGNGLAAKLAVSASITRRIKFTSQGILEFVRDYGSYEELLVATRLDSASISKRIIEVANESLSHQKGQV